MSKDTKQHPILAKAFEEFLQNYQPSTSTKCELKTTAEIQEMFNELTGLDSIRFEIADGMKQAGFSFKMIGDEFMWMMEKV